jgi:hypothetical protein
MRTANETLQLRILLRAKLVEENKRSAGGMRTRHPPVGFAFQDFSSRPNERHAMFLFDFRQVAIHVSTKILCCKHARRLCAEGVRNSAFNAPRATAHDTLRSLPFPVPIGRGATHVHCEAFMKSRYFVPMRGTRPEVVLGGGKIIVVA